MLTSILKKIRNYFVLRKYDDFTIADYFRRQGAQVGKDCRIMIRSLDEAYLVKIGDHCSISSGVRLITHDGGGWIFSHEMPAIQRFGKIEVKDNSYIGMNCIILPNVTIGPNSIVGAGSVVTKNVPPHKVVAGNPAQVIRDIASYKAKLISIWEQQKPPGYLAELDDGGSYSAKTISQHKNFKKNSATLKRHLKKSFSYR